LTTHELLTLIFLYQNIIPHTYSDNVKKLIIMATVLKINRQKFTFLIRQILMHTSPEKSLRECFLNLRWSGNQIIFFILPYLNIYIPSLRLWKFSHTDMFKYWQSCLKYLLYKSVWLACINILSLFYDYLLFPTKYFSRNISMLFLQICLKI
jgi:hypothetical protein